MAYTVRDRRATTRWVSGLTASVVVVVVVCAATGRWWVAVVGVPLSLALAGRRARAETTPLHADGSGISLDGHWTAWGDVDSVTVSSGSVRVCLTERAPLPSWSRGRVTRSGVPADRSNDRLRLAAVVPSDRDTLLVGIREQAPASVRVE
jgi:hypothetical protein